MLEQYGLSVDVRMPLADCTGGQRAVVAMARAFERLGGGGQVQLLVLDEPTAALEDEDVHVLFAAVKRATQAGAGVIFVSHDLAEIREVCTTVSVLRDGDLVAEGPIAGFSERDLIQAILGKDIGEIYPATPRPSAGRAALEARNLVGNVLRDVSLTVQEGEVVGVTGLAGMGQDELPEAIYAGAGLRTGEVRVFGERHRPRPDRSLARGMILVPADRPRLGADLTGTVSENLTAPVVSRYFQRGWIRKRAARREVGDTLREYDVRPAEPSGLFGELSGGNQQKALLGKWLGIFGNAQILVLHEPTQGVDVGARQAIFTMIRDCAARGVAILYVSCEHDDLAHLCNRVMVMRHGRVVAEVGKAELSADRLAHLSLAAR